MHINFYHHLLNAALHGSFQRSEGGGFFWLREGLSIMYRITRARDGAIDGDYATYECAESAMKHWTRLFKDDDFVLFKVTKQHRIGGHYWRMMKSRDLVIHSANRKAVK